MLIVAGGQSSSSILTSTEVLPYPGGTWREAAPLPAPGWVYARGAVLGGRFHVAGGYDGQALLARVLAWDPVAEAWDTAGALATPRSPCGRCCWSKSGSRVQDWVWTQEMLKKGQLQKNQALARADHWTLVLVLMVLLVLLLLVLVLMLVLVEGTVTHPGPATG